MASLDCDRSSGIYHIRFRYGRQSYKRSLGTQDSREAEGIRGRVEETIRLTERGRLELPPGADPGTFFLSDGKLDRKADAPRRLSLTGMFAMHGQLPVGAKESNTLYTESIHKKHLLRILGATTPVDALTTAALQRYIDRRLREKYRGQPIGAGTVKKEIATFRAVWNWAARLGHVPGPASVAGLVYPKQNEKPPFMTWGEIERIIGRGGLSEGQKSQLWKCLFLDREQIDEVLRHVKANAGQPFIYPMFVFVAHTGVRRSEMLRSRIDDFDFQSRSLLVREKKRSRTSAVTYRRIPMTDLLAGVMRDWFAVHPGGQYTICQGVNTIRGKRRGGPVPLTRSEAHDHFKRPLQNGKWERIRGFHVFRHSFASNLAAAGIDQRIIDEWMGHQTETMRRRYRHLFPDQQRKAIDSVFPGNGK